MQSCQQEDKSSGTKKQGCLRAKAKPDFSMVTGEGNQCMITYADRTSYVFLVQYISLHLVYLWVLCQIWMQIAVSLLHFDSFSVTVFSPQLRWSCTEGNYSVTGPVLCRTQSTVCGFLQWVAVPPVLDCNSALSNRRLENWSTHPGNLVRRSGRRSENGGRQQKESVT